MAVTDPSTGRAVREYELPGVSARTAAMVYAAIGVGVVVLLATAATRMQATVTLGAITAVVGLVATQRQLLAWPTLLGLIVAVILFIPIRRYTIGGGLPFLLEPYRVVVALVLACWLGALLVDPKTQARRTGLEPPVLAFAGAVLISLMLNIGLVTSLSGSVLKSVTFFASFFFIMYLAAAVITDRRQLDRLVVLLVVGATIVGLAGLFEWKTENNLFNHLGQVIPVLDLRGEGIATTPERGDRVRAYASAQHAIALGAALVMLMPFAIYLFRRSGKPIWLAAASVLTMGALATGSRTAILMLVVDLIVFLWLKRRATVRMLPLLLPLVIACQVVMPGTLGTFRALFFPKDGLVADEQGGQGTGTGRLADVGPSLEQWRQKPFFGQGFGTRLTSQFDGKTNAIILDDQWLASLLEVGLVGVLALVWLLVRAVRRLKFHAKSDDSSFGWLLTAMAASITAFGIGMLTYDAFSFTQVTFLLFIVLGLSAGALHLVATGQTQEPGTARAS
jgi:hypothetical protein